MDEADLQWAQWDGAQKMPLSLRVENRSRITPLYTAPRRLFLGPYFSDGSLACVKVATVAPGSVSSVDHVLSAVSAASCIPAHPSLAKPLRARYTPDAPISADHLPADSLLIWSKHVAGPSLVAFLGRKPAPLSINVVGALIHQVVAALLFAQNTAVALSSDNSTAPYPSLRTFPRPTTIGWRTTSRSIILCDCDPAAPILTEWFLPLTPAGIASTNVFTRTAPRTPSTTQPTRGAGVRGPAAAPEVVAEVLGWGTRAPISSSPRGGGRGSVLERAEDEVGEVGQVGATVTPSERGSDEGSAFDLADALAGLAGMGAAVGGGGESDGAGSSSELESDDDRADAGGGDVRTRARAPRASSARPQHGRLQAEEGRAGAVGEGAAVWCVGVLIIEALAGVVLPSVPPTGCGRRLHLVVPPTLPRAVSNAVGDGRRVAQVRDFLSGEGASATGGEVEASAQHGGVSSCHMARRGCLFSGGDVGSEAPVDVTLREVGSGGGKDGDAAADDVGAGSHNASSSAGATSHDDSQWCACHPIFSPQFAAAAARSECGAALAARCLATRPLDRPTLAEVLQTPFLSSPAVISAVAQKAAALSSATLARPPSSRPLAPSSGSNKVGEGDKEGRKTAGAQRVGQKRRAKRDGDKRAESKQVGKRKGGAGRGAGTIGSTLLDPNPTARKARAATSGAAAAGGAAGGGGTGVMVGREACSKAAPHVGRPVPSSAPSTRSGPRGGLPVASPTGRAAGSEGAVDGTTRPSHSAGGRGSGSNLRELKPRGAVDAAKRVPAGGRLPALSPSSCDSAGGGAARGNFIGGGGEVIQGEDDGGDLVPPVSGGTGATAAVALSSTSIGVTEEAEGRVGGLEVEMVEFEEGDDDAESQGDSDSESGDEESEDDDECDDGSAVGASGR